MKGLISQEPGFRINWRPQLAEASWAYSMQCGIAKQKNDGFLPPVVLVGWESCSYHVRLHAVKGSHDTVRLSSWIAVIPHSSYRYQIRSAAIGPPFCHRRGGGIRGKRRIFGDSKAAPLESKQKMARSREHSPARDSLSG